jgi:hypothetical protein
LVGKPGRKRPLGIPGLGRIIIAWILTEIMWEGVDWIHLAQDRDSWRYLVNMAMNLWVPYKADNFFTR